MGEGKKVDKQVEELASSTRPDSADQSLNATLYLLRMAHSS